MKKFNRLLHAFGQWPPMDGDKGLIDCAVIDGRGGVQLGWLKCDLAAHGGRSGLDRGEFELVYQQQNNFNNWLASQNQPTSGLEWT